MQFCTYQHFVLLCITIFKTNMNMLLILNFSLRVLAKLSQQSLLGAAVNIDLFIVVIACDCDWESFSPLCIITFYCHIKRKRNQNWLVVQLYCLIFHHGQTELSPLIPMNFFLLPIFLCIRTFILLAFCLFMAYFICDINFPHPWNIKIYICVVFVSIHFYLLFVFLCVTLQGFLMVTSLSFILCQYPEAHGGTLKEIAISLAFIASFKIYK